MLNIRYTAQFRKDIKKIEKSGHKDMEKLKAVVRKLTEGNPLENKYRDHPLSGNLKSYRDCHIEPDWLLLYRIDEKSKEIIFTRTGSHSELFG